MRPEVGGLRVGRGGTTSLRAQRSNRVGCRLAGSSTTTAENSLCGPKVGSAVLVFWLAIMEMFDNKRSRFGYTRCMQAGKFLIEMAGVVQW